MKKIAFLTLAALIAIPALAFAQAPEGEKEKSKHKIVKADAVMYEPIDVPGFDSGMQIAVLQGEPMGESGNYTLRLKFPDGYRFPAHYHPKAEQLTVLSGTFLLARGETEDYEAVETYAPGAYMYIPPEDRHYGGATGQTVIQLHGTGPWGIEYLNPEDDPRN